MDTQNILNDIRKNLRFNAYQSYADASVLLAITQELQPKILLTKRSSHLNKHAGEISFPGGKRDPEDNDDIQVALREANEEVGIEPFFVELVGELPIVQSKYGLSVKPIVGILPKQMCLTAQPDEIEKIFFVDIADFIHSEAQPYSIIYQDRHINVPSFQLQGEIIWGLTARMIVDLLKYGLYIEKRWNMLM